MSADPAAVLAFLRRVAAATVPPYILPADASPAERDAADAAVAEGLATRYSMYVTGPGYLCTHAGLDHLRAADAEHDPFNILARLRATVAECSRGECADDGAPETDRGTVVRVRPAARPESPAAFACGDCDGEGHYLCDACGDSKGEPCELTHDDARHVRCEQCQGCGRLEVDDSPEAPAVADECAQDAPRVGARLAATLAPRSPEAARALLALLRRLAEAEHGPRWLPIPERGADALALAVLVRAALATPGPRASWARITERGVAFLDALDALIAPAPAPEPPPAPRAPLDGAALDALTDDAARALLDADGLHLEEALHIARRYALAVGTRAYGRDYATAGVELAAYAGAVTAHAYVSRAGTRCTVATHQGTTDRAAVVGIARKLLARWGRP